MGVTVVTGFFQNGDDFRRGCQRVVFRRIDAVKRNELHDNEGQDKPACRCFERMLIHELKMLMEFLFFKR